MARQYSGLKVVFVSGAEDRIGCPIQQLEKRFRDRFRNADSVQAVRELLLSGGRGVGRASGATVNDIHGQPVLWRDVINTVSVQQMEGDAWQLHIAWHRAGVPVVERGAAAGRAAAGGA